MREAPSGVSQQRGSGHSGGCSYAAAARFEDTAEPYQSLVLSIPCSFPRTPFFVPAHRQRMQHRSTGIDLTCWQTTHKGRPKGSAHSPGPRGSNPSPSPLVAVAEGVPSRFTAAPPRPLSFQDDMISSISLRASVLTRPMTSSRTCIQFHIWRSHRCGCDQSRSMTKALCGTVSGVSRGEMREANSVDGWDRR